MQRLDGGDIHPGLGSVEDEKPGRPGSSCRDVKIILEPLVHEWTTPPRTNAEPTWRRSALHGRANRAVERIFLRWIGNDEGKS